MFKQIRELMSDAKSNRLSSKRFVLLQASTALSLAVVILAVAACYGVDVGVPIAAVATPLAGLAGYSYIQDKKTNSMLRETDNENSL